MAAEHLDSFGARDTLEVGGRTLEIFRLDALQERFDVARLPFSLKVLLENLLRTEDGQAVTREDIEALAGWDPAGPASIEIAFTPSRVLMQDFTGVPGDRRSGRDARRDGGAGRRPAADQPAGAGRAGDRPFDPGRRVRRAARVPAQRRAGVRAQPRALRVPALGPDRVRQLRRRAAEHRHLPPGEPRVPRERGARARRAGVPGHARRAPTRTRR